MYLFCNFIGKNKCTYLFNLLNLDVGLVNYAPSKQLEYQNSCWMFPETNQIQYSFMRKFYILWQDWCYKYSFFLYIQY